jgi:MFS family permease
MRSALSPILALLLSVCLLIAGNGLLTTLLPLRGHAEGFDAPLIGLFGSTYFLGLTIGCFVAPRVISRVGHIRTFAAAAAVATATPLLHGLILNPWAWVVLRALSGVCFAALYAVIDSWLNERADNETRGQVIALYSIINFSANAAGQQILRFGDVGGQVLFSLAAILTSLAAVPLSLSKSKAPNVPRQAKLQIRWLYETSPVAAVGCLAVGFANGAFWTLAPVYAASLEGGTRTVAGFMTAAILGSAVSQWPIGRLSDRLDRRKVLLALLAIAFGVELLLMTMGLGDIRLLYAAAFAYGACALTLYAICLAHANDLTTPGYAVEIASGLLLLFGLGAFTGPVIAATLMQAFGPSVLFGYTLAVHLALFAFVFYRITRRAPTAPDLREPFLDVPRTSPALFELDPRNSAEAPAE